MDDDPETQAFARLHRHDAHLFWRAESCKMHSFRPNDSQSSWCVWREEPYVPCNAEKRAAFQPGISRVQQMLALRFCRAVRHISRLRGSAAAFSLSTTVIPRVSSLDVSTSI